MVTVRTYDADMARYEFDYLTKGWEDCGVNGLRRIKPLMLMVAEVLPADDPRHEVIKQILERCRTSDEPPSNTPPGL